MTSAGPDKWYKPNVVFHKKNTSGMNPSCILMCFTSPCSFHLNNKKFCSVQSQQPALCAGLFLPHGK